MAIAQTNVAAKPAAQSLRLGSLSAEKMEGALRGILRERLRLTEKTPAERPAFVYVTTAGQNVELVFDRRQNSVTVRGADTLVDQMTRMILAVERSTAASDRATDVIAVRQADPVQVLHIIDAYRSGEREGEAAPISNESPQAGKTSWIDDSPSASSLAQTPSDVGQVRPVAYRFQSPDGPSTSGGKPATSSTETQTAPAQSNNEKNAADQLARPRLRSLDSDLEVETLPDLDAIILRGRKRDVQELRRIIEELERLSVETQPQIAIVYLKNVACEPLSGIVKQVEKEFTGGRQGRVNVVALIKPNALLLIGWGEALKLVKELIEKLDLPITPEALFRVFPLRHAAASEAQVTIQNFLTGHAGLASQVRVIADVRTNSLIVQAGPRDLEEVALLVQRLDQPQGEAVRQARVFKLKNSLAADVAATLHSAITASRTGTPGQKNAALELLSVDSRGKKLVRAGLLNDVQITPDPRANSLIVAGAAESMELLEALVKQLDTPPSVAQIKVFRIVNGDARSLIQMLHTLLPSAGTGVSAARDTLATAEGESTLVPVRFSVDLRTNCIIATGSQSDLAIIEVLLLRLDEDRGTQRKNTVYRLKNAYAPEAAKAINEFLRSERQVQQTAAGVMSPFQQMESEVIVVAEPVNNALIISATPRFFNDIMEVVEKLDAEPPQVMIQVIIAEVALDDFDEFGMELGLQDSILFNRSLLGNLVTTTNTSQTSTPSGIVTQTQTNILGATNTPGFNWNNQGLGNSGSTNALSTSSLVGPQGLSSFGVGRTNGDLGYGGLVLSASSESVSLLIRALKQSERLDVLSRPQVMTLDNQPAFIQVGQRVPRIASASITQVGQQNNIVLENVGLILGVTPRISPDGRVIMEVDAEKSELGDIDKGIPVTTSGSTVIKSPTINLTTAQTTVSAIDGETIVIGGLITKNTDTVKRRVPYLSDIPVVGLLFRYDSHSKKKTEMLIILTPHIVRTPEDAERVRAEEERRIHWCLGDVNEIGGPMGPNVKKESYSAPTIYPDANPRGKLPPTPTPDIQEPQVSRDPSSEPNPSGLESPSREEVR